jgi:membrane protease YdiL (CAAX protease family)
MTEAAPPATAQPDDTAKQAVSGASWAAFAAFLLTWVAMIACGGLPREGFWAILREPGGKLGLLAVVLWFLLRRPATFRFHRVSHRTLGLAALCGLLNVPISQGLNAAMLIPLHWVGAHFESAEPYAAMTSPAGAALGVLLVLFGVVVEELLFRGYALSRLEGLGPRVAVGLSAALFAASHMNFLMFPWAFILGVYAATLVLKTGSLWPGLIAHGVGNVAGVLTQSFPELNRLITEGSIGAAPHPMAWFAGSLAVSAVGLLALRRLVGAVEPTRQLPAPTASAARSAIERTPVLWVYGALLLAINVGIVVKLFRTH